MFPHENDSRVPFNVREGERAWNESYKKHKERLAKIKTGTGNFGRKEESGEGFLHLHLKLKKLQLEEDRYAYIDYENRKLLDRLIHIMKAPPGLDNWNKDYKKGRSLHSEYKKSQDKKIKQENIPSDMFRSFYSQGSGTTQVVQQAIHNRLKQIRPMSLSAPAIPDLINKTRERLRASEEKKIHEENLALKQRIDAVRNQVSITPMSELNGQSMKDASRGSKKSVTLSWSPRHSSKSVPLYNYKEKKIAEDNLETLIRYPPQGEVSPSIHCNTTKAIDPKALHNKLVNVRGTIDFREMEKKAFKAPKRLNRRTISVDEIQFIENNLQLQRQMNKVVNALELNRASSDSKERQKLRESNVKSLKAAIKVENEVAGGYLGRRRQKQNRERTNGGFTGPYAKENYELHKRIMDIKKGKREVDIWRNTFPPENDTPRTQIVSGSFIGSKESGSRGTQSRTTKSVQERRSKNSVEEEEKINEDQKQSSEEAQEQDGHASESFESIHSWGEVNEDIKQYNVPPGYRKKFRKKRKKRKDVEDTSEETIPAKED